MNTHIKETAGPVGAGTGAGLKAGSLHPDQYANSQNMATVFYWDRSTNSVERLRSGRDAEMNRPRPDDRERAVRSIGYALTLDTSQAWEGLSLILEARTTTRERAALAYAALKALDDDTAYRTASVALFGVIDGEVLA
ncbi:hypothetical protein A3722_06395 [Sulfitobacter sp. HI0027]|nr:hypothetical protein A3720_04535 [Sulfitobacter sp. HI0021]KZY02147.1 hypothetical protein A3722_06395 [Sulfitobacter sp. HI0027]